MSKLRGRSQVIRRPRRLRSSEAMRRLVRETRLSVDQLVYPIFVKPGQRIHEEITSMPGQYRFSIDLLANEANEIAELKIPAVLLFGLPEEKDELGSGAYDDHGIVQQAVRAIKKAVPDILVVGDVCLCEYTDHGHCGVIRGESVENDESLEMLARTAVSQAAAGADVIAPSAMMDGQVAAIREALDEEGFSKIPIMSYAAKYASAFYGPFREAADSAPQFGDRKSYQMDSPNIREAIKEMELDAEEGADILMVKPALAYLDVIQAARESFELPIAAYNVSGEYSMVKAAARNGWIDEERIVREMVTGIVRAGADIVITYFAKDLARKLK
ncbi:porphobilinogen synthase [Candidatus Acetothermia bacterium]|nr:porphobilinogen synthase [Candidatus Acetothermia bacterium]MBI3642483.1 porphobilinogen synthase [Candidatus Acetothermia bacterium]